MQNLNKHQKEQTITKTENLCVKMVALKSFVLDQIYIMKKRSNDKDDELWIKTYLINQNFENNNYYQKILSSKWFSRTTDYKSQTVKETSKQNNQSDKVERKLLKPRKTVKMRPLNNIPQFVSPNRCDVLQMTTDETTKNQTSN